MKWAFYRALGMFGLLTPWNRMVCRSGRYFQYQPGVCGWCGEPHVKVSAHWRRLGYGDHPHDR